MCPIITVCVAFADCHYHILLRDSAALFVYALHFFQLTQAAPAPSLFSCSEEPWWCRPTLPAPSPARPPKAPGLLVAMAPRRVLRPGGRRARLGAPLPCFASSGESSRGWGGGNFSSICNAKTALLMWNRALYSAQVYTSELCKSVMENILPLILGSVKP